MAIINRPRTNAQREAALRNAKTRKDSVPPPAIIPFMPSTITKLDIFQPAYRSKYNAVIIAKNQQTTISANVAEARKLAIYHEQDFIDNLNKAIRRGLFAATVRSLYNIDNNDSNLPYIGSESDIITWGENINLGETTRLATPGEVPVTFPSLPEVLAAVSGFSSLNLLQANAKDTLNSAQEALEADNAEADKLILKLWNEIETAFNEGDRASMRSRAREWGVVYTPTPGEEPSPEDFSIMGKITVQGTGAAVEDAEIKVVQTGATFLSESNGDYFISVLPPGNYTLEITKTGYEVETLPVTVTAGAIMELDIALSPVISVNGTVAGTVTVSGTPTAGIAVSIVGVALPASVTDASGHYSISGVQPGTQTVRAQLPAALGGGFLEQVVNVVGGSEVAANFSF